MNKNPTSINKKKLIRGFTNQELQLRTERAQRKMLEQKLDALLLTTEPNVRYFSGFHSQFWQSPTRPWFLLIPIKGKPIAVIPEIGLSGMKSTWIEAIHTWPAPRPEDDGISLLASTLKNISKRFHRIGITLGHETHLRMPAGDFSKLIKLIQPLEICDCTKLIQSLRNIKSVEEIAKIRKACDITSKGFESLPASIKAGETEREICEKLQIDLLKLGADNSPFLVASSGVNGYQSIIMGPSDRIINSGDVLIIDTGTVYDGYFSDFDRNYSFGPPSEKIQKINRTVHHSLDEGFKLARPGIEMLELFYVMWSVLEKGGAKKSDVGRMGHGIGMQLTEGPSITPYEHTILEAGMVITLEPGMAYEDKQMVHEENIVITESGAEMLSWRVSEEMMVVN